MVGKIRKAISGFYYVEFEEKVYECRAKGILKKNNITPLVGDWVEFEVLSEKEGNVLTVVNRNNALIRPPVANVDKVIIVVSLKIPEPSLLFIDKQLVFLQKMNLTPVICLNKTDLEEGKSIWEIYEKIGYRVLFTSAKEKSGIEELKKEIQGKTAVFVGNSGVGKSSLTNLLINEMRMEEGSLSKIERGKQTTRHSELLKVCEDTYIIDTPGFSSFELSDIESKELALLFAEFSEYTETCRYDDCTHVGETECGVKQAVAEGKMAQSRYESFVALYQKLKEAENRRY
ncbi:MAG: ribosome small subunit-dependent GTPase A [Clostridia bacterium]|nr:ribosome small subunit-dependent GTPase A [Clostridia bacterium]